MQAFKVEVGFAHWPKVFHHALIFLCNYLKLRYHKSECCDPQSRNVPSLKTKPIKNWHICESAVEMSPFRLGDSNLVVNDKSNASTSQTYKLSATSNFTSSFLLVPSQNYSLTPASWITERYYFKNWINTVLSADKFLTLSGTEKMKKYFFFKIPCYSPKQRKGGCDKFFSYPIKLEFWWETSRSGLWLEDSGTSRRADIVKAYIHEKNQIFIYFWRIFIIES